MNPTLIVVLLVAAGIATALASARLTKRGVTRRFGERPSLKPEEVLAGFGPEEVEALKGLWTKLESVLGVPSGKLRLTDRFQEELRPNPQFAIYNRAAEALEDLQECFPHESLNVTTLRDFCAHALRLRKSASDDANLAKRILG